MHIHFVQYTTNSHPSADTLPIHLTRCPHIIYSTITSADIADGGGDRKKATADMFSVITVAPRRHPLSLLFPLLLRDTDGFRGVAAPQLMRADGTGHICRHSRLNGREKVKGIAERGFDPRTSGLWAQHASTAPLCYEPTSHRASTSYLTQTHVLPLTYAGTPIPSSNTVINRDHIPHHHIPNPRGWMALQVA